MENVEVTKIRGDKFDIIVNKKQTSLSYTLL